MDNTQHAHDLGRAFEERFDRFMKEINTGFSLFGALALGGWLATQIRLFVNAELQLDRWRRGEMQIIPKVECRIASVHDGSKCDDCDSDAIWRLGSRRNFGELKIYCCCEEHGAQHVQDMPWNSMGRKDDQADKFIQ